MLIVPEKMEIVSPSSQAENPHMLTPKPEQSQDDIPNAQLNAWDIAQALNKLETSAMSIPQAVMDSLPDTLETADGSKELNFSSQEDQPLEYPGADGGNGNPQRAPDDVPPTPGPRKSSRSTAGKNPNPYNIPRSVLSEEVDISIFNQDN